jgi:Fe-S-cluster containining protein
MLKIVPTLAEFDLGDGVCRHLNNSLCTIYDTRPLICNVGEMFKLHFQSTMTMKQFILKNLKVCIELAEQADDKISQERIKKVYATYL